MGLSFSGTSGIKWHTRVFMEGITETCCVFGVTGRGHPWFWLYIDGLVQDSSNSIANALRILQYYSHVHTWYLMDP